MALSALREGFLDYSKTPDGKGKTMQEYMPSLNKPTTIEAALKAAQTPATQASAAAPTALPVNSDLQNRQNQLLDTLHSNINQAPLTNQLMNNANDQALKSAMAQAVSARGMNAGTQNRLLQQNMASTQQGIAQQGVTSGLQEQGQNRTLFANALQNASAQDTQKAVVNAQLATQVSIANQAAELQKMGLTNDQIKSLLALQIQKQANDQSYALGQQAQNTSILGSIIGGVATLGAGALLAPATGGASLGMNIV